MSRSRGDLLGELAFFFRLRHLFTAVVGKAIATVFTLSYKAYQQVCATYVDDSSTLLEAITNMVDRAGGLSGKSQSSWTTSITQDSDAMESSDKVKRTLEDAIKRVRERHVMAFLEAASVNDTVTVRLMLEDGLVHVDVADYDLRTALHLAASNGHIGLVRMLVDKHQASTAVQDRYGGTPLDDGIREGHFAVVQYLAAHQCGKLDIERYTDKLIQAAADNKIETMKLLVAAGMDPNCYDYDYRTPLHVSASNGCSEAVQYLMTLPKIQLGPVDRIGDTPLWNALIFDHKNVATMLSSKGAPIQKTIAARLCNEAANNNVKLIESLIQNQVDILLPVRPGSLCVCYNRR